MPLPEKKKVMTSYDVSAVVKELKEKIVGRKIDNIYQLDERTFLFKLRPGPLRLLIEIERRLHLTVFEAKIPKEPTLFCKALRNRLRQGTIDDISQYRFERIVYFTIKTKEGKLTLIAELFRRGNLILIDENSKILLALRYAEMKDRCILPKETFKPPPTTGVSPFNLDVPLLMSLKDKPLSEALLKLLAVGSRYVKEILLRAGLDGNKRINELTNDELGRLIKESRELGSKLEPCLIKLSDGTYLDVTPFPLKIYSGLKVERKESFNEALDEYFSKLSAEEAKARRAMDLEKELKRIKNLLSKRERRLVKLTERSKRFREAAELLQRHALEIDQLRELIIKGRSMGKSDEEILSAVKGESKLSIKEFVESLDSKNLTARIMIGEEPLIIDLKNKPFKEASKYFEKAKEAEKKLLQVKEAVEKMKLDMVQVERERADVAAMKVSEPKKMRERKWFEKFRWFRSSEGFLVLLGKDSGGNEVLIKRYTNGGDVVLHAEIYGAPFAVVKTDGKTPREATLKEAAVAAVSYSKAWSLGLGSADVYWVSPRQLSKKPPSGQYLRKGMFMVYGPRNYLRGVEPRLRVGLLEEEGELKVVCGPPTAIEKETLVSVEIAPGELKSSELAKLIVKKLFEKAPRGIKDKIKRLNLTEIQSLIPSGKGKIVD